MDKERKEDKKDRGKRSSKIVSYPVGYSGGQRTSFPVDPISAKGKTNCVVTCICVGN